MNLDPWLFDVRLAVRTLRRDWGYTLPTVAMLALAIALNVAVFAVVSAILFRGYPVVKRNDQLVYVQEIAPSGLRGISYPDFEAWTSQAHAFDGMGLLLSGSRVAFKTGDGRSTDLIAFTITANAFGLLGVAPVLGRDFASADALPGAPPVAILGFRFWEGRFGKRPDIVGSTAWINGAPATIIGVMPERFDFPDQFVNVWMPVIGGPGVPVAGTSLPGSNCVFHTVGKRRPATGFAALRPAHERSAAAHGARARVTIEVAR